MGRQPKKKFHNFSDESKEAFLGGEDVREPWDFSSCEAYIDWCHISREYPHYCSRLHCHVDKANLHHSKWLILREQ